MPEKYRRPYHHERVQAIERMQLAWEAERDALATVRRFNVRLSAKRATWFWPKIAAAITAKHPWLVIACDSCGTVVENRNIPASGAYINKPYRPRRRKI